MTILRGHFAMVLVATAEVVRGRGRGGTGHADGRRLAGRHGPRGAAARSRPRRLGTTYLLTVHGADRPGIVATVTGLVAEAGGNITDLSTRLSGDLYVLLAEVDLAGAVDPEQLSRDLADRRRRARRRGVAARPRPRRAVTLDR